ncbi:MAG: hypothetical protein VW912_01685 [Flavobacteriaceae bacterium]
MKTYFLSISLFFSVTFFVLAQDSDIEYRVTKEYNENGDLIRYDSIRTQKNKWVSSHYSFNFNEEDLDSLLGGLKHIGNGINVIISDSISQRIDQVLKDKNFHIWMDEFDHNDFSFKVKGMDSLATHACIKMHHYKEKNDSIMEKCLEKELKHIEKKLEKIKEKIKQEKKTIRHITVRFRWLKAISQNNHKGAF